MALYTEEVADKIISYWQDKVKGRMLIFIKEELVIGELYKDEQIIKGAHLQRFKVRVKTYPTEGDKPTPVSDELIDVLHELKMLDEISNFDWERGEEKKSLP